MRYALLMHYQEPGEGQISEERINEARDAFGAYGRALESAGVLVSADVLQPPGATATGYPRTPEPIQRSVTSVNRSFVASTRRALRSAALRRVK